MIKEQKNCMFFVLSCVLTNFMEENSYAYQKVK